MRNKLQGMKERLVKKKQPDLATVHVGSLCSDSLSGYYQMDYEVPKVIKDFLKNGTRFIQEKIKAMNPDGFNASFLDRYIDDLIELAKAEIEQQRVSHERAILDIRTGQATKVRIYKKELEKIEEEMSKLHEEVEKYE